jgi:predicted  nucleic acid-binding Zn-ribbon protein
VAGYKASWGKVDEVVKKAIAKVQNGKPLTDEERKALVNAYWDGTLTSQWAQWVEDNLSRSISNSTKVEGSSKMRKMTLTRALQVLAKREKSAPDAIKRGLEFEISMAERGVSQGEELIEILKEKIANYENDPKIPQAQIEKAKKSLAETLRLHEMDVYRLKVLKEKLKAQQSQSSRAASVKRSEPPMIEAMYKRLAQYQKSLKTWYEARDNAEYQYETGKRELEVCNKRIQEIEGFVDDLQNKIRAAGTKLGYGRALGGVQRAGDVSGELKVMNDVVATQRERVYKFEQQQSKLLDDLANLKKRAEAGEQQLNKMKEELRKNIDYYKQLQQKMVGNERAAPVKRAEPVKTENVLGKNLKPGDEVRFLDGKIKKVDGVYPAKAKGYIVIHWADGTTGGGLATNAYQKIV